MDEGQGWVPAVIASDYDGHRHLVALTEDVDDWEVTVILEDGSEEIIEPQPARGFYYYPKISGQPCWFIDQFDIQDWRLCVGGRRIHNLRGNLNAKVPDEDDA